MGRFLTDRRLLLAGGATAAALALGALVFPETVWRGFLWRYFWGPIVADGAGVAAVTRAGVTAHAGYNIVNEIGYGLVLGWLLLALVTMLRRFGVGGERGFVLPFVPFVVAGGMLRVVEDAMAASAALALPAPWRYLLISPLIYGTMFVAVLGTLLAALWLARRGSVASYRTVVAGAGTVAAVAVGGVLAWVSPAAHLWVAGASLAIAAAVGAPAVWYARRASGRLALLGTPERAAVLGGHLLDGAATAVSFELVTFLDYGEKHPLVAWFIEATGTAWSFLGLKLVVIGGILVYMDERVREDDPLFFNLVLLAMLAIGLGPGVRNMTRAVLGV